MNRNFRYVAIGLIFGLALGISLFYSISDRTAALEIARYFALLGTIFLKLIKMIIGPLVLSTLVVGIGQMGDAATIGRVGAKTMVWFILASIFSLLLGVTMANILQPGVGTVVEQTAAAAGVTTQAFNVEGFVEHLVPTSVFKALAEGEILQIVVFSVFAGFAVLALGERGRPIIDLADQVAQMMLVMTGYVMKMAPVAVFGAVASVLIKSGPLILVTFAKFMGGFYLTLAILWVALILAGYLTIGIRVFDLLRRMYEPIMLSFSTASSEASFPKILEQLDRFGVKRKIASFVLPLGYSFNLDGSMAYTTFATIFIAQAYGIEMSLGTQLAMAGVLMITSKGIAGVPRASLVVILATLKQFGLPESGLLLIIGIDQFLDMGRAATNAVGNSIAVAAVAKFEGELDQPGKEPNED